MDLGKELGANSAASAQKFSLYLPDSDRDGIEQWIEAAMALFASINGGATRLPEASGIWGPAGAEPVRERTSVVYSFIRDNGDFAAGLRRLAIFIHSFGKHANQGEVMVEFSGEVDTRYISRAYFIDAYPLAAERPF